LGDGAGVGEATGSGLGVTVGGVGVALGVLDASRALVSEASGPMSDVTLRRSASGSAADTHARLGSRSGRPFGETIVTTSATTSMAARPVSAAIVLCVVSPLLVAPHAS